MTLTQNQKTYLVLVAVMLAVTAAGLYGSHLRTQRNTPEIGKGLGTIAAWDHTVTTIDDYLAEIGR